MKTKTKRPTKRPTKGKSRATLPTIIDTRNIQIIGSLAGVVVASDKAAEGWKAERIAHEWRGSGLEVAIVEKMTA